MLGSISVELLIDFLDKVLVEGKMPRKSTMEPLSCVRQLVKKYREKRKKLCMMFIDLETEHRERFLSEH